MDLLYPFREIYNNYDDRVWWKTRFVDRILGPFQERRNDSSFRVMDEDWDVLIVLDACRADLFRECVNVSQFTAYETRVSAGSATNEWANKNFSGQALSDVVYVTGNPVVSREVQTAFAAFIEVWRTEFDEELGTVPPNAVTEAAVTALENYPHKRLIVHYLQPHYPFINYPELRYGSFGMTDQIDVTSAKEGANHVWTALDKGYVDEETVWEAYQDNLNLVMNSVNKILEKVDGRVVITSDHGNLVGEKDASFGIPLYGHPPHIYQENLRTVPWAVSDSGSEERGLAVDDKIEYRLKSLGYK